MYWYNGEVSTTFAPAENSTFALNGWFMHAQSHMESHMIRVCVHGESSSVSVMLENLSECSRSSMTHLHTHTHTHKHTHTHTHTNTHTHTHELKGA